MRIFKKILLSALVLIMILFSFSGCGKILTVEKAEKQLTKVQDNINKGFDYVELTRFRYDDSSKLVSEELFLVHSIEEKLYYALYNYVEEVKNEGEGSETVVSKRVLVQRFWEYKDGEAYKIVSEEMIEEDPSIETVSDIKYDLTRIDVTVEDYKKDVKRFYEKLYRNLLPESKEQLKEENLVRGNLNNLIKFECSEEIPEVQITINNATNKIHKAFLYYADGTYSKYEFNYPMIKGLVKKTEIPPILPIK